MHLLALLVAVSALQAASVVQQESRLDLQNIVSDDAALGSVEVLYSVERQLVALHGDGRVLMQSTSQQLGAQSSKPDNLCAPCQFCQFTGGCNSL